MKILERHPELIPVLAGEKKFDFRNCYTLTNPEGAMAEEDVAAALIVTRGHFADAAKILRRSRQSVFNYVLKKQDLFDLREEIFETAMDDIERSYIDDALTGDTGAKKFFLTTRAKNRGYSTRVEHTGKDEGPIETSELSSVEIARCAAFTLRMAMQHGQLGDSPEAPSQSGDENDVE